MLGVGFQMVLFVLMLVALLAVPMVVDVAVDFGIMGTTAPPRRRRSLVLALIIFVIMLAFFLVQFLYMLVGFVLGGLLVQFVVVDTYLEETVLVDCLGQLFMEVIVIIMVVAASRAFDSGFRGFSIGRGFGGFVLCPDIGLVSATGCRCDA